MPIATRFYFSKTKVNEPLTVLKYHGENVKNSITSRLFIGKIDERVAHEIEIAFGLLAKKSQRGKGTSEQTKIMQ